MSHVGGPVGVLVIHGFTGNPGSMRALADAAAEAGHTVEMPLLPGHGTEVTDMLMTRWSDWSAAAFEAYDDLRPRVDTVIVAGLSMGGSLALWLATQRNDIDGIVCINPAAVPQEPEVVAMLEAELAQGNDIMPGIGSDIAKEGVVELAYDGTPVAPLLSLQEALRDMAPSLASISTPLVLMTSPDDHVVSPADSDHIASTVSGPVRRVTLARSYHVATQDHDQQLIIDELLRFANETARGARSW